LLFGAVIKDQFEAHASNGLFNMIKVIFVLKKGHNL
jgi:hypothetical protein